MDVPLNTDAVDHQNYNNTVEEYILPLDEDLYNFLKHDKRIIGIQHRIPCRLKVCNRRYYSQASKAPQWSVWFVISITGPDSATIDKFNKCIERAYPNYKLRKLHAPNNNTVRLVASEFHPQNIAVYQSDLANGASRPRFGHLKVKSRYAPTAEKPLSSTPWKAGKKAASGVFFPESILHNLSTQPGLPVDQHALHGRVLSPSETRKVHQIAVNAHISRSKSCNPPNDQQLTSSKKGKGHMSRSPGSIRSKRNKSDKDSSMKTRETTSPTSISTAERSRIELMRGSVKLDFHLDCLENEIRAVPRRPPSVRLRSSRYSVSTSQPMRRMTEPQTIINTWELDQLQQDEPTANNPNASHSSEQSFDYSEVTPSLSLNSDNSDTYATLSMTLSNDISETNAILSASLNSDLNSDLNVSSSTPQSTVEQQIIIIMNKGYLEPEGNSVAKMEAALADVKKPASKIANAGDKRSDGPARQPKSLKHKRTNSKSKSLKATGGRQRNTTVA